MTTINLTKSLRTTVTALNEINENSLKASQRMTSGVKVTSAIDDPSAFASSKKMSGNATMINDYLQRIDQGVQVIQAANNGITAISGYLDSLKSIAQQGAASDDAFTRADLVSSYNDLIDQISTAADDASYSGKNLLQGAGNDLTLHFGPGADQSITINAVNFTNLKSALGLEKLDTGKLGTMEVKLTDGSGTPLGTTDALTKSSQFSVGDVIAVKDGSGNTVKSLTVKDTTTVKDLMTAFSLPDTGMRTSLDESGVLKIETANTFSISGGQTGTAFESATISATPSAWVDATAANDNVQTVMDAKNYARQSATDIGVSLTMLQNRANFMDTFAKTLNTSADNLVASDYNEEAAKLLALQTSQQMALSSFSITQTADNGILRLLGGGS